MPAIRAALSLALLLAAAPATATTWAEASRPDPLAEGKTCAVHEPMSYGSYIYHWPSKYDQVFWPLVDAHGLWTCEHSGFTALIGDFDGLGDAEKARLREWLAANRGDAGAEPSLAERLRLLEGSYAQRDTDPESRIRLLRVLAYYHDELEAPDAAGRYRAQALAGMRTALEGELPLVKRLEYLFVAAAYSQESGDAEAAARDRAALQAALDGGIDEETKDYADYLRAMLPDLERIRPGGALAPAPERKPGDEPGDGDG